MLVRPALPHLTPCSADLYVRFCDGHEGSIADASELHESGSPSLLSAVGTSEEPSFTAPTNTSAARVQIQTFVSPLFIRRIILVTTVFFVHKFLWA